MRKLSMIAALIIIAATSCQKNEFEDDDIETIDQSIVDEIASLGFNVQEIRKIPEGYLVEGDIILTAEYLKGVRGNNHELVVGESEHYTTYNLVTGLPRTITIRVNSSLPARYFEATDSAIARFNALGLDIDFARVTTGGDILINGVISLVYLAAAGFPSSSGDPYHTVNVNRLFLDSYNINTLVSIIAHEVGHTIGFRHTDYMDRSYSCGGSFYDEGEADVGAVHIPGTPTTASADSWMLSCISNGVNRPFTAADIIALQYIY